MTSAEQVVKCIRGTDLDGVHMLTDSEAALMVNLFASVAAVNAEMGRPVHIKWPTIILDRDFEDSLESVAEEMGRS